MRRWTAFMCFAIGLVMGSVSLAESADAKQGVRAFIETHRADFSRVARQIWEFAEVGYQEEKSSALLKAELAAAGFQIQSGVAEIPTAFVASYGNGRPVIGFLAEYDALPGMSQVAEPVKKQSVVNAPGHACGHHLLGTASTAAAVALKHWLESSRTPGTIRLYGTPAEEGGAGKVYMVRAGLFDDVDAVIAWHPGDSNNASPERCLANKSAKFRFSRLPEDEGTEAMRTSALDGVEAMSYMVNLFVKHLPPTSVIQYIVSDGGDAPNVLPDFAEIYFYCRNADLAMVKVNWDRIVRASEAAAIGTRTRVEHEVIHGLYPMLPNQALSRIIDANLRQVGGVTYTPEDREFAEKIQQTLTNPEPIGSQETVEPWRSDLRGTYSTDVGDISWIVPTGHFGAATWAPGTPGHSWQAVAQGGMSIGFQGMIVAAETMATTGVDLFTNPEHLKVAKQELLEARGADFRYESLLGDRKPALDYRK